VSQFLTNIFGLPTQSNIGLRFTQWLDDFLPTPGATGVPDLMTQPLQCMTYLNGVRDLMAQSGKQKPLIRLGDSNLEVMQ
jgi:hypothetical protein